MEVEKEDIDVFKLKYNEMMTKELDLKEAMLRLDEAMVRLRIKYDQAPNMILDPFAGKWMQMQPQK